MTHIANCPECNKKYKVPHLEKAWQCKVCKVPLELPSVEGSDAKPERPKRVKTTCPACGAVVPGKRSSCRECGESFVEDPYASPEHSGRPPHERAPAGSRQSMEESAARGAAKKELRKLGFLRFLIKFGLFTTCLGIIQYVVVLTSGVDRVWPAIFLVVEMVTLWFLWSTHQALATIYGRPRPYVIVLAVLYTIVAIGADNHVVQVVSGLYAAMYWMFVATLGKIEAIKDENPSAFADPEQVRSIAADEKLHRRRMAEAKRAAKERNRRMVIFGGIGLAILVGLMGYKALNKPPTPDSVLVEFQSAWNRWDVEGVSSLAAADRQATWVKRLNRRDKKREWGGKPPILEKGLIESAGTSSISVNFPSGTGFLVAKFALSGKKWILKSLDYRGLP